MNAIQEILRTIVAILIEEGWYVTAIFISIVLLWRYRHRIKGWLRNLRPAKKVDTREPTPMKPPTPPQENTSVASPPTQVRSDPILQEEVIADETRLERIMEQLRDQSPLTPLTDFGTSRLKREVLTPLHDYLSRLVNNETPSAAIVFSYTFHATGRTTEGKDWDLWNKEKLLEQLPDRLINLNISYNLTISVSNSREGESRDVRIAGWFVGDDDGIWKVRVMFSKHENYEVQMYNWYELKQRISKVVADFLDNFVKQ